MSNTRAIGAVTAGLSSLLGKVNQKIGIEADAEGDLAPIGITSKPPNKAREQEKGNQLNLFLYQITPNAALRNADLYDTGSATPKLPLAFDLHYLLTAYGEGAEDVLGHRLLGRAMALLHQHAVVDPAVFENAVPGGDLDRQIERVRITPQTIATDEMSKLWTIFQTPYRLSVGYLVSVVLIDNPEPPVGPLPVRMRGRIREGNQEREQLEVNADLVPRTPVLSRLTIPGSRPAARIGSAGIVGDKLTLEGSGLGAGKQPGASVAVKFEHLGRKVTNSPKLEDGSTDTRIQVVLPAEDPMQPTWPAGIYSVTVIVNRPEDPDRQSNAVPMALAPRIQLGTAVRTADDVVLPLTVSPKVWPDQDVVLLFDDRAIPLDANLSHKRANLTFTVKGAPVGLHNVRLRVDGVESLLIKDYEATPPQYDPSQQRTI